MLKKYKILMVIIILSLTGIITVISIWLYGSYSYRLEVVVTDVERSLSNTIQNYYQLNSDKIKQRDRGYYQHLVGSDFISLLSKEYKNVDSIRVKNILDSLLEHRFIKRNKESLNRHTPSNRSIVPPFILEQLVFDDKTVTSIDSMLQESLFDKGITFAVKVFLQRFNQDDFKMFKTKVARDSLGMIITRPILVNSSKGEYLSAHFDAPISYVLGKMFWQLFVVFILVVGLIGTFVYLFWTINRQNKLALLRKSFVNNMTHELKTPVSTVTAGLEAVTRYAAKGDVEKMGRYLAISQQELLYLTNMIDRVLQLNIDEVNGLSLNLEKVNVSSLIHEVIELSKLISTKSIDIRFDFNGEDVYIQADKSHLKNVLNNLLDNAVKYARERVNITVELYNGPKDVVIKFADQGIGIPNHYLKDIFDMFFRVPNGDIYSVKGFGLGLAYVKQVVEQHGGTIDVKSELGNGTTFIISIPA